MNIQHILMPGDALIALTQLIPQDRLAEADPHIAKLSRALFALSEAGKALETIGARVDWFKLDMLNLHEDKAGA